MVSLDNKMVNTRQRSAPVVNGGGHLLSRSKASRLRVSAACS